ncbi:hypothetical protein REPUB_Repub05bG0042500 [Reevesia pubescens]
MKSSFTFFLLPTKDIVTTSALSTRWQSLWTFFTILNFDFDSEKEKVLGHFSFLDLIQRELLLIPDSARIRKFRFNFNISCHASITSIINLFISLLSEVVRHKVEELDCWFRLGWTYSAVLSLPHTLFSSESLTSLKLNMSFPLTFPTSICLPRLKTLHLRYTKFQDERSAQLLFSACLVLEELFLHNCSWNIINGITISIATLQTLTICNGFYPHIQLKICSPNLKNFKCSTSSLFELVLCDLPSLDNAHVSVSVIPTGSSHNRIQLAHWTIKLLERIRGLKSLTLPNNTLRTISRAEHFQDNHLHTFFNLTHLRVSGDCGFSAAALMCILQKSPILKSLDFPDGLEFINLKKGKQILKNVVVLLCLNHSLKTFSISRFQGSAEEVLFLNYILKNANVLEWFTVNCSKDLSKDVKRKEGIRVELRQLFHTYCVYAFL